MDLLCLMLELQGQELKEEDIILQLEVAKITIGIIAIMNNQVLNKNLSSMGHHHHLSPQNKDDSDSLLKWVNVSSLEKDSGIELHVNDLYKQKATRF